MNNKDLYDAIKVINQEYIDESNDFENIASEFKKTQNRRIRTISSICSSVFIFIGIFGAYKGGIFDSKIPTNNRNSNIYLEAETTESLSETSNAPIDTFPITESSEKNPHNTTEIQTQHETVTEAKTTQMIIDNQTEPSVEESDIYVSDDANNSIDSDNRYDIPKDEIIDNNINNGQTTEPITQDDIITDDGIAEEYPEDTLGYIYIDGTLYLQSGSYNLDFDNRYTFGEYLGNAQEFDGYYTSDSRTEIFHSKEDTNVILIKFYDGSYIPLFRVE